MRPPEPPRETSLAQAEAVVEAAQWMRHKGIPAWLLSLLLHLSIFTVLGLVLKEVPHGLPAGDDLPRGGEIVLARGSAFKTEYFSDGDGASSTGNSSAVSASAGGGTTQPLPDASDLPGGGPQLPKASGINSALPAGFGPGGADPFGSSLRPGGSGSRGGGIGGKAQTQVFGVQGTGSRFVYVFDRSSSMSGFEGRPLSGAKRELIASLAHLDKVHQFQIIFYNQAPRIMQLGGAQTGMVFADEDGRRLAAAFVSGVVADGGTRHMEALTMALGMRPDVIFFLTDADEPKLSADELAKVRHMNHGTSINAIEFGAGPPAAGSNFLKELARENGGNYGYVDVTQLPRG